MTAGTDPQTRLHDPRPAALEAPSPAVAPPPGNPRFPLFDALRGLAVLAVIVYHVCSFTGTLERRTVGEVVAVAGALAPPLFFAISGFLLYRPWIAARTGTGPPMPVRRFLRRRALRILPAYWVALTLLAIFPAITGVFTDDWWRYYLFLQVYDPATLGLGIPVAWTLCVEVTFYLLLPLWALAMRRARLGRGRDAWARGELAALALLGAAGAAVQVAAGREAISDTLAVTGLGQSTWFAVGMAVAVVSVAGGRVLPAAAARPTLCWATAATAFVALVLLRNGEGGGLLGIVRSLETQQPYAKLLADIGLSTLLLTLVIAPVVWDAPARLPQRLLAVAPLAWLGLVSYSIYLWHLTVAELLILPEMPFHFEADGLGLLQHIPDGGTVLMLALTLAVSGAIAALSYRYVELPFLRRKEG